MVGAGLRRPVRREGGDGESEEGDLHPRRIGGETLGLEVALTGDGFALHGYAMRCHDSRSDDGLGVFVIVGPR